MQIRSIVPLVALVVVAAAACSDATGADRGPRVSLSFASVGTPATANRALDARAVTFTSGESTLEIISAQLVLSHIELVTANATACAADEPDDHPLEEHEGCEEIELSPMAVDIPVDNSVATALTLNVPAGTYTKLEAKIRPATANDGSVLIATHPDLSGASVRVQGTFDGVPFTYVGSPEARLELPLDPPLTVTDAGTNITVHVAVDRWFRAADGSLIDPATANAGGANAARVADNVTRSFRAFEDEDRRGDDGRGTGDDDHGGSDGDGRGEGSDG